MAMNHYNIHDIVTVAPVSSKASKFKKHITSHHRTASRLAVPGSGCSCWCPPRSVRIQLSVKPVPLPDPYLLGRADSLSRAALSVALSPRYILLLLPLDITLRPPFVLHCTFILSRAVYRSTADPNPTTPHPRTLPPSFTLQCTTRFRFPTRLGSAMQSNLSPTTFP